MNRLKIIPLVVIACLLCVLIVFEVDTSSGEDTELHLNMKEDMSFVPEPKENMDASAASIRVEADYYEDPILETRTQKDWVPVGTWTSEERLFNFSWTGELTINVHYSIHQEGYEADPEFEFGLRINGGGGNYMINAEDNGDEEVYVFVIDGSWGGRTIESTDVLEFEIQYSGYEDCSVYFDNITFDSGIALDSDFLRPQSIYAKDTMVEVQVCDAFDTHWDRVVDFWQISVDGEPMNATVVDVKEAGTTIINETEVNVTSVEWQTEELIEGGANVEVWMMYSPNVYSDNHGMRINVTALSGDYSSPIAVITGISPDPANEGEDVTFDASGSSDEDGDILIYRWSSDLDGRLYQGGMATYTSDELSIGTHTIILDVQDDDELWSDEVITTIEVREVTNEPPEITLLSPTNGITVETDSIILEWEGEDDDGDDLTYTLYFGTDDPPEDELLEESDSMAYEVFGLEDGETYFWMVKVSDGTNTTASEIRSFSVDLPDKVDTNTPPEILLLSPQNGSIVETVDVTLMWRGEDDDRNDDLTYTIYSGISPTSLHPMATNISQKFFLLTGLVEGMEYYWQVEVTDGKESVLSEQYSFLIEGSGGDRDDDEDGLISGFDTITVSLALIVSCVLALRWQDRHRRLQ